MCVSERQVKNAFPWRKKTTKQTKKNNQNNNFAQPLNYMHQNLLFPTTVVQDKCSWNCLARGSRYKLYCHFTMTMHSVILLDKEARLFYSSTTPFQREGLEQVTRFLNYACCLKVKACTSFINYSIQYLSNISRVY